MSLVYVVTALLLLTSSAQEHQRGAMVMGFDQEKTAHHFRLYTDGGAIEVGVRDATDTKDREAIRSHLPHIAMMFKDGNFDAPMLVHDSTNVPGTKVMASRKDVIQYHYTDTATGGSVSITTSDPEALHAIHEFLRYQIAEHKTGDPTVPKQR